MPVCVTFNRQYLIIAIYYKYSGGMSAAPANRPSSIR